MVFTQDLKHGFAGTDLTCEALEPHLDRLKASRMAKLVDWYDNHTLPLLRLPETVTDLDEIEEVGQYFRKNFAHVLVVGTGGSSLGGQTLAALTENAYDTPRKGAPKLHFLDNVDPHSMSQLLDTLDMAEVGCLVISKSGGTAEIIAQMLVLLAAIEKAVGKDALAKHFVGITEPSDNPLRRICQHYHFRVLDHDPKVGGRFSVLSLVGLIPAAAAGVDVRAVRQGAHEVMQTLLNAKDNPADSAPAVGAAMHYALLEAGRDVAVVMPYCDRLGYFGMWFRQLWAESLGKDGKGSTPVRAMGTVDQHSQLQLYLDGPKNKFLTLIHPDVEGQGPRIDGCLVTDDSLAYIRNQTIGDVMTAHEHGTARTLVNQGCPVRILRFGALDAKVMGALLMHFMLETVLTADLMGIDAYDQPAVEESKILARDYLSQHSKAA